MEQPVFETDYDKALQGQTIESLEAAIQKQKTEAKQLIADAQRKDKKRIEAEQNVFIAELEDTLEIARQRVTIPFSTYHLKPVRHHPE